MLTKETSNNHHPPKSENNIWPKRLPPFILEFFQLLGIENPPPSRPTLSFEELETQSKRKNPLTVQKIKNQFIENLVAYRASLGIGPNMKTRAQCNLQEVRDEEPYFTGDPSTWMLDPTDQETCLAVGKYLFEVEGRKELWIGFAMQDDFVDTEGDKNVSPPLIRGIKNVEELKHHLQEIQPLVHMNLAKKLAKRLVKTTNPFYNELTTKEIKIFTEAVMPEAIKMIADIQSGSLDLEIVNATDLEEAPLSMDNHFLIKLFAQDNPNWQVTDVLLADNELTIELPTDQYTPRKNGLATDKVPPRRIVIRTKKDGTPVIFADEKEKDIKWLMPFLNSENFLKSIDKNVMSALRQSPYYQFQIMLELGLPVKSLNPDNTEQALSSGKIAFITDIISGIHTSNTRDAHTKTQNITDIITALQSSELEKTLVLPLIFTKGPISMLYELLKKSNQHDSLNGNDRETAMTWLKYYDDIILRFYDEKIPIPPSTKKLLNQIANGQRPTVPSKRTILMLEQKLEI